VVVVLAVLVSVVVVPVVSVVLLVVVVVVLLSSVPQPAKTAALPKPKAINRRRLIWRAKTC
jgi:hypothetical protein